MPLQVCERADKRTCLFSWQSPHSLGMTVSIQAAKVVVVFPNINNLFRDKRKKNRIVRTDNWELKSCEYPLRISNSKFINFLWQCLSGPCSVLSIHAVSHLLSFIGFISDRPYSHWSRRQLLFHSAFQFIMNSTPWPVTVSSIARPTFDRGYGFN